MEFNYWAVFVAAIAAWGLGAIWYNILGKTWQKEAGLTDEQIKSSNMALIYGSSFALELVIAMGLIPIIKSHPPEAMNFWHGGFHGLLAGLFFGATIIGINYLFQRRSFTLWLIDAGYALAFMALEGAILGVWA